MNTIKMISKSLLVGLMLMFSASLFAQESMKDDSKGDMNSKNMKVILDNEKVQVIQVEYAPGQVAPFNYYPEHVAYVVSGGKMEMTEKGKEAKVMEINEGEAMYMPSSTEMFKNVGTTTVKLIVTTMKPNHKMIKGESAMQKEPNM